LSAFRMKRRGLDLASKNLEAAYSGLKRVGQARGGSTAGAAWADGSSKRCVGLASHRRDERRRTPAREPSAPSRCRYSSTEIGPVGLAVKKLE